MCNFVNYKLEIKDASGADGLEDKIIDFLKEKFNNYGMVFQENTNNYVLVVSDELNYSDLNAIWTEFFKKFNLSLVCYKQVFSRKVNN